MAIANSQGFRHSFAVANKKFLFLIQFCQVKIEIKTTNHKFKLQETHITGTLAFLVYFLGNVLTQNL